MRSCAASRVSARHPPEPPHLCNPDTSIAASMDGRSGSTNGDPLTKWSLAWPGTHRPQTRRGSMRRSKQRRRRWRKRPAPAAAFVLAFAPPSANPTRWIWQPISAGVGRNCDNLPDMRGRIHSATARMGAVWPTQDDVTGPVVSALRSPAAEPRHERPVPPRAESCEAGRKLAIPSPQVGVVKSSTQPTIRIRIGRFGSSAARPNCISLFAKCALVI